MIVGLQMVCTVENIFVNLKAKFGIRALTTIPQHKRLGKKPVVFPCSAESVVSQSQEIKMCSTSVPQDTTKHWDKALFDYNSSSNGTLYGQSWWLNQTPKITKVLGISNQHRHIHIISRSSLATYQHQYYKVNPIPVSQLNGVGYMNPLCPIHEV